MKVQVLVATMNQKDNSLVAQMNINSDAIIGNQTSENSIVNYDYNGHQIVYLNFNEKGVGLNRNNALMRATADYCIFSDDDVVLYDNYEEKIIDFFNKINKADVLVFNIDNEEDSEKRRINKVIKISNFNYMRYGAIRIAVKTQSIREKGIFFNLCYGGGAVHSSGEDTLFLHDCLKKGLNIYAIPATIGKLEDKRPSTWFVGYNDKYFADKGCLYKLLYPKMWKLYCFQDAFRHHKTYGLKTRVCYKKMVK